MIKKEFILNNQIFSPAVLLIEGCRVTKYEDNHAIQTFSFLFIIVFSVQCCQKFFLQNFAQKTEKFPDFL